MIDYLEGLKRERRDAVRAIGIKPGDFINILSWFGDVWSQVESVYDNEERYGSVTHYRNSGRHQTEILYFDNIRKVHRANDPWDWREVRIIHLPDGNFGDRHNPALPERFFYKGTFSIEPWLWNYCGRNVAPKEARSLQPFLELAGVSDTGIPWNEAQNVIAKLKEKRIKGWYPICSVKAEQTFGHTMMVKTN